ncbi:glycosyltransferase [Nocardioides jiangxiensis]|uniref:Glycosyltransferase n=1 Tax=Nocardioides jiangxiensis TaxID=3064524 RepID=A0ABT9B2L7_9ACTN|nr:glycosyltransferase [Nocardioides sp. WY-20]MDO7869005.1 glycosyltransferase [Nocardioides sp. WY-20]
MPASAERPRHRIAFLLGKDPALARGGDVTLFTLLRRIADERHETSVICLSEEPDRVDPDTVRVAKPPVALPRTAARALVHRRSLVHERFDVDGLVDAVEAAGADRVVAVHSYLAEPYLRARDADPARLLVSTEVSEAPVWRSRGLAGRIEARRIERDELRIARTARAIAGYDASEMEARRSLGIDARWLPLTLPPAPPVDVAASAPRLVLLGNRHWPPNARAVDRMLAWWPSIARGIPGAELWLVGPRPDGPKVVLPGVVDHGEVRDVAPLLAGCRAMVAPVAVGGGVRVKVLEAAARGLPVVTSPAGVGSIESLLGLDPVPDDGFVARCRDLLGDASVAAGEGARLHATNEALWTGRRGRDAVLDWLDA